MIFESCLSDGGNVTQTYSYCDPDCVTNCKSYSLVTAGMYDSCICQLVQSLTFYIFFICMCACFKLHVYIFIVCDDDIVTACSSSLEPWADYSPTINYVYKYYYTDENTCPTEMSEFEARTGCYYDYSCLLESGDNITSTFSAADCFNSDD